jgi:hypothetical protein
LFEKENVLSLFLSFFHSLFHFKRVLNMSLFVCYVLEAHDESISRAQDV